MCGRIRHESFFELVWLQRLFDDILEYRVFKIKIYEHLLEFAYCLVSNARFSWMYEASM